MSLLYQVVQYDQGNQMVLEVQLVQVVQVLQVLPVALGNQGFLNFGVIETCYTS